MPDPFVEKMCRTAGFVLRAGVLEDVKIGALAQLAPVVARAGLNVRSIHALHALQTSERVALVDESGAMTYGEVDAAINRIARAFLAMGVHRGDRVVLCMENRAEYVLFWFAGFRAGIGIVHAGSRSTTAEIAYLAEHSGARAIVCSRSTADCVAGVLEEHSSLELVVVDDIAVHPKQHRYPQWARPFPADFYSPGRDTPGNNVVYTSGTTGKPKGAVRDFSGMGIVELSRIGMRLPLQSGERHLVVCPLYHSGAQAFVSMLTALGATIHLRPHFDARDALEQMSRWSIHSVFMVPTMIQRILDLDPEVLAQYPTPELRALVSGAASFPDALRRRAVARFGPQTVWDFYGATEMGWITLIDGIEMLERPGSVGRALDGHELCVRDAQRNELAPGRIGTIWVRTGQTMQGYLHDQAATEQSSDEGWITVDDLGYLDEAGYLYLAGRDRDMVISGGVNIYPVEIEEVYSHHPGLRDVAVVGLPDEEWGERLVAFAVGSADHTELTNYGKARLAAYKVPRQWIFVDELPRNPTGKVLKRELRERGARG